MTTPCANAEVPSPTALSTIGRTLLARVEELFDDAGVALPARRLWAVGEVPWDCEQVVVSFTGLNNTDPPGIELPPRTPCYPLITAEFTVSIVRCIPVLDARGDPPSPEVVAASADTLSADAYLLQAGLCRFDMYGSDNPNGPQGGMTVSGSVAPTTAQGTMQATVLTLSTIVG